MINSVFQILYIHKKFDMDPMVPFPPAIEPDLPGAFITKHPRETITSSKKVPFVTGITFDEGALKSARKNDFFYSLQNASNIIHNFFTNFVWFQPI